MAQAKKKASAKKAAPKPAKPTAIRQTVTFKATPDVVYGLLMSSKGHSAVTGEKAVVDPGIGGKTSAYGGYISAKNIELVVGRRIVQAWRATDWPKGHWSTVEWTLVPTGKGGCKMVFVHSDVPADQVASIRDGWVEYYWDPIKAYLKEQG